MNIYTYKNLQFTCRFTISIGTKYTQVSYRAWYHIFVRKNSTYRNHSQTSFRAKLRYSVIAIFCFAEQIFMVFGIKLQCLKVN